MQSDPRYAGVTDADNISLPRKEKTMESDEKPFTKSVCRCDLGYNHFCAVHGTSASNIEPSRTYEQGLADGMRKMAEAACKAVCYPCRVNGHVKYPSRTSKCQPIRRAAKELDIDLSAALDAEKEA